MLTKDAPELLHAFRERMLEIVKRLMAESVGHGILDLFGNFKLVNLVKVGIV